MMKTNRNAVAALLLFVFGAIVFLPACTDKAPTVSVTPDNSDFITDKGWKFDTIPVWQDEFSGKSGNLDLSKWSYEPGGNGWGNNELECYTSGNNTRIADSALVIEARKEPGCNGRGYTSAKCTTNANWLYGRFVARMKLPAGAGTWPAFWMLPSASPYGGWPRTGEIDIMEHVGKDPNIVHQSAHCALYNGQNGLTKTDSKQVGDVFDTWHEYRLDWTPAAIRQYVDTTLVMTYLNPNGGIDAWPYNVKFRILLNLAIGGTWGGTVDPDIFPARMQVDYVRVYPMIEK